MSHTEIKEVEYLNGQRIKVGGLYYLMERACRDVSQGGVDFMCSECGTEVEVEYGDSRLFVGDKIGVFDYCPHCGARVVGYGDSH